MEFKELLEFVKEERMHQIKVHGVKGDSKTRYTMLAKLMEEVGELSESILKSDGLQRSQKLDDSVDVGAEMADVVIVTMILANELNIDINTALEKKIEKVISRRKDY